VIRDAVAIVDPLPFDRAALLEVRWGPWPLATDARGLPCETGVWECAC